MTSINLELPASLSPQRLLHSFAEIYMVHVFYVCVHTVQVSMAAEITSATLHHGLPFNFS